VEECKEGLRGEAGGLENEEKRVAEEYGTILTTDHLHSHYFHHKHMDRVVHYIMLKARLGDNAAIEVRSRYTLEFGGKMEMEYHHPKDDGPDYKDPLYPGKREEKEGVEEPKGSRAGSSAFC